MIPEMKQVSPDYLLATRKRLKSQLFNYVLHSKFILTSPQVQNSTQIFQSVKLCGASSSSMHCIPNLFLLRSVVERRKSNGLISRRAFFGEPSVLLLFLGLA